MDSSIRNCWTRNAYFRAAINFSTSLVDQIERETKWADEEIVRYAAEQSSNRAEYEKELRRKIARQTIKTESALLSRQTQLDEEADQSKRIDQDIRKRFPLSTLDEKSESELRITLRSRLLENLKGLESGFYSSNPNSPSCTAASQTALLASNSNSDDVVPQRAGLYFIPRGIPPTSSSRTVANTEPTSISQKDIDIAQFEFSMRRSSDLRKEAFLNDRADYFRQRVELLKSLIASTPSKSEKKMKEELAFSMRELHTVEKTRREFQEEREERNALNSARLSKLRERVSNKQQGAKKSCSLKSISKSQSSSSVTAGRSPLEERVVSIIRYSLKKDTLSRMISLNSSAHANTTTISNSTPLPEYGLMHFVDLPLPEDSHEEDIQVTRYLWPSELEQSIPHVLTGWCRPLISRATQKTTRTVQAATLSPTVASKLPVNGKKKKWRPILLSEIDVLSLERVHRTHQTTPMVRGTCATYGTLEVRDESAPEQLQAPEESGDGMNKDAMLAQAANYGNNSRRPTLPGEAHLAWMSIKGVGDFIACASSFEGCELE